MAESFEISRLLSVAPERLFSAWLDASEHTRFTGGKATGSADVGGGFTAWDGYIHGILLGVDAGKRIVQTWRTSEFPPEYRDSRVVIEFEAARGGTRVRIRHGELPPSQVKTPEWKIAFTKT